MKVVRVVGWLLEMTKLRNHIVIQQSLLFNTTTANGHHGILQASNKASVTTANDA